MRDIKETEFSGSILIAGGAGFIGTNLSRAILSFPNTKITILDNLLSSETSNIPKDHRVKFIFGSASDSDTLSKLEDEYDYIFNLCCFHGNQSSIKNPIADHQNNTLTSLMLLERIKDFKAIKAYIYAGAACAVAEKTYDTASETLEDQPVSLQHDTPYSISKIIGEMYANYYSKQHGLRVVKARFSNAYGKHEVLGAGQWRGTVHSVWRNAIPTFIWKCLHGEPIELYANGEATRDFIFAEDMAKGLILCALRGEDREVYNLATGVESKVIDVAKRINDLCGGKSELILSPARDWDNSGKRFASTIKSYEKLGFEAQVSIADGLEKTVEWTQENIDVIRKAIDKHACLTDEAQ